MTILTEAVLAGVGLEEEADQEFFKTYIRFLRSAGHHVLFGLPDFGDSKTPPTALEYTSLRKRVKLISGEVEFDLNMLLSYYTDFTYHGITIEQINTFILVNQYEKAMLRAQAKRNTEASCIMTVKWSYENTTYDIKFVSPRIVPLCSHELLFVLKVEELKQGDKYVLETYARIPFHHRLITMSRIQETFALGEVVFVVDVSEFDGKVLKVKFRSASLLPVHNHRY